MSVGADKMEERKEAMKTWQVEYSAAYWVKAETEDEAIELAIEQHSDLPDGDWNAELERVWPEQNV